MTQLPFPLPPERQAVAVAAMLRSIQNLQRLSDLGAVLKLEQSLTAPGAELDAMLTGLRAAREELVQGQSLYGLLVDDLDTVIRMYGG
jgi:hypothetical protein